MAAVNRLRAVPAIIYVLAIFFISSQPNLHPPGPDFPAKDKVAHFAEYFVLGVLLFKGIGWSASRERLVNFLFLFAVGASVGAFDEILQSYTPGRTMSIYDWAADSAGIVIGLSMFIFSALGGRRGASSD